MTVGNNANISNFVWLWKPVWLFNGCTKLRRSEEIIVVWILWLNLHSWTYSPTTQWAAVKTQVGVIIDPPQKWEPEFVWSDTCKYNTEPIEFSLNRTGFQVNSGKLRNHWSMNWAQFKDPHCYLCLHGTLEAFWFITQEVGGSNTPFCNNNFYRFCRFFRINLGKTGMCYLILHRYRCRCVFHDSLRRSSFSGGKILTNFPKTSYIREKLGPWKVTCPRHCLNLPFHGFFGKYMIAFYTNLLISSITIWWTRR